MKRTLFSILFFAGILFAGFAQDKKVQIGLRLAPNLSFTEVNTTGTAKGDYSRGSTTGKLMFGPIIDFFFGENYAFSTGLLYNVKSFNVKYVDDVSSTQDLKINAQYLSVPLTLKLFTNEIADDIRIYFQVGGVADFKIGEKYKNDNTTNFVSSKDDKKVIKPINVGPYLGVGVEYVLSSSNTLFGGIHYNRGVIQQFKKDYTDDSNLKVQSSQLGLEIGLKF